MSDLQKIEVVEAVPSREVMFVDTMNNNNSQWQSSAQNWGQLKKELQEQGANLSSSAKFNYRLTGDKAMSKVDFDYGSDHTQIPMEKVFIFMAPTKIKSGTEFTPNTKYKTLGRNDLVRFVSYIKRHPKTDAQLFDEAMGGKSHPSMKTDELLYNVERFFTLMRANGKYYNTATIDLKETSSAEAKETSSQSTEQDNVQHENESEIDPSKLKRVKDSGDDWSIKVPASFKQKLNRINNLHIMLVQMQQEIAHLKEELAEVKVISYQNLK